MRRRAGLTPLAVIASLVAGCGASGAAHRPAGQALFAQACGACHSLSGRESPRRQGGDLLGARLSPRIMLQFAREMPVARPLSSVQLRAVADYVVSVERRPR
jgi:mono/diheme cytochrome c family protein